MKRTVMRCRADYSGQAWPGQAIDRSGVATRVIAKIFSGTELIPRHHDSLLEAARDTHSVHTLITSGYFRSSSKIEPAIDTHSYRHTPTV